MLLLAAMQRWLQSPVEVKVPLVEQLAAAVQRVVWSPVAVEMLQLPLVELQRVEQQRVETLPLVASERLAVAQLVPWTRIVSAKHLAAVPCAEEGPIQE
jgi:hypothetical protein